MPVFSLSVSGFPYSIGPSSTIFPTWTMRAWPTHASAETKSRPVWAETFHALVQSE